MCFFLISRSKILLKWLKKYRKNLFEQILRFFFFIFSIKANKENINDLLSKGRKKRKKKKRGYEEKMGNYKLDYSYLNDGICSLLMNRKYSLPCCRSDPFTSFRIPSNIILSTPYEEFLAIRRITAQYVLFFK